MNPIELVWGYLKKKLSHHIINSKDELMSKILEIWEQMPYEQIYKSINKVIDERAQDVIKLQGAWS